MCSRSCLVAIVSAVGMLVDCLRTRRPAGAAFGLHALTAYATSERRRVCFGLTTIRKGIPSVRAIVAFVAAPASSAVRADNVAAGGGPHSTGRCGGLHPYVARPPRTRRCSAILALTE